VRETWLCHSMLGIVSDVEDDLWFENSEDEGNDDRRRDEQLEAESSRDSGGNDFERQLNENAHETVTHENRTQSRKLTLGCHLDVVRGKALRTVIPPVPVTPVADAAGNVTPCSKMDRKRHRKFPALDLKRPVVITLGDEPKKNNGKSDKDAMHIPIYMEYDREVGFGETPKPQVVFVVDHVWSVYAALFMTTACVHCVSFNVSPALRRLFRIEALPVGLCIVFAWTILGLVNCLGSWVGSQGDRVALLRRLSWLWIVAIVLLQLAKVLPVVPWFAHTLLGIGYVAAVLAHGLLVPNVIAIGTEIVGTKAMVISAAPDDNDVERRQQEAVEATMGAFITSSFGVVLAASSLIQAFFFAMVDLELSPTEGVLVLRSQRSIAITTPCAAFLLALIVIFLFQSRHHYAPATAIDSRSSSPRRAGLSKPAVRARNALERKLAQGAFESFSRSDDEPSAQIGLREWFLLARRSAALIALAIFTLVLVIAVGTVLISQAVTDRASTRVHLALFVLLSLGWIMTMLLSTSQLAPSSRDKLYGHIDDLLVVPVLPSRQQLFVLVALLCLASAVALAAFVRAQLYSTLFVQTCQLRRPHGAAVLYDPNALGAWVGLASVLLIPPVHCALRFKAKSRPRVSAVRRVVIGVLLYLISIFLSSVVELYRRAARWPSSESVVTNPVAAGCVKTHPANFTVLWSVPHLVVLSLADAIFQVAAAEEAHTLTAPLGWLHVAQGVVSLADSVGYASALALTRTLSPWLYRIQHSDLVLLLLLVTAVASLSYALTKRLADHVHASRRPVTHTDHDDTLSDGGPESPNDSATPSRRSIRESDAAGRKEAPQTAHVEPVRSPRL
jgi:hypothetical protein